MKFNYCITSQKNLILEVGKKVFDVDVFKKSRKVEFVDARNLIIYVLSDEKNFGKKRGFSVVHIAKLLEKDHTTILYSKQAFQDDLDFKIKYDKVKSNKTKEKIELVNVLLKPLLRMSKEKILLHNVFTIMIEINEKLEMVREFNSTYNVPMYSKENLEYIATKKISGQELTESEKSWNKKGFDIERLPLRVKLLKEELSELNDAIDKNDIVEIADALGDIYYIALGGVLDVTDKIESSFIFEYATLHELSKDMLLNELEVRINTIDLTQSNNTILSIRYHYICLILEQLSDRFSIDLHDVFKEIHASNMSKLGEDGKPIYREDGKILKGKNYFKPNIEKVLKLNAE